MSSVFLANTDYEEAQMSPKNNGLPLPLAHDFADSRILGKGLPGSLLVKTSPSNAWSGSQGLMCPGNETLKHKIEAIL